MLPSEQTARVLLDQGVGPALPGLVRDLVERSALIAAGLYVAGQRRDLVKLAIAGALAVEVGVIHYVSRRG